MLEDATGKNWRAFQAHRATETNADRESEHLEMKDQVCEQLNSGQNCENMKCSFADLSTQKVGPSKNHPSYLDE